MHNGAATALLGGFAFGRRFNPTSVGASAGIRGRVALRYVDMRDTSLTDWQLDGGIAFETARVMDSQRLELSLGFEFRYSGNREAAQIVRSRFAEFRAGIFVPYVRVQRKLATAAGRPRAQVSNRPLPQCKQLHVQRPITFRTVF